MGASPKVLIINGNPEYRGLFLVNGWEIAEKVKEADLIQFTGGEDVSPSMYGEPRHPTTGCNGERDAFEAAVFNVALQKKIPMTGICRGGQFLNVMCGGAMWQDVDNHALGVLHEAHDNLHNCNVNVSSTHHQMMRPSEAAEILLTARRSSRKERMGQSGGTYVVMDDKLDVEACFYEKENVLCFQPHPEFARADLKGCRTLYFSYLDYYLGLRKGAA